MLEPPVQLVATVSIGRFGYYSGLPILDLVGLVDPAIARSRKELPGRKIPGHQRVDTDYVFSRDPDVILIPKPGNRRFVPPAVKSLHADPRLEERYRFDPEIPGFVRRDRD
jgi:hypothetical protein